MLEPKTLRYSDVQEARIKSLDEPHVAQLTKFVENLRRQKGSACPIPYFDPLDAGINARALLLMEAPGPQAIASGFVSQDNPDETAKNLWVMNRLVGLDRKEIVLWNVCPWYVGGAGRIRPVFSSEVREAAGALRDLLKYLNRLECVALVGRKAQLAKATVEAEVCRAQMVLMPHPSPAFVNRKPGNRDLVEFGLRQIAMVLKG